MDRSIAYNGLRNLDQGDIHAELSSMDHKDLACDRYYIQSNITLPEGTDVFHGIPHNLIAAVILGALGLLLFSILRKSAWDYGRAGLIDRSEKRWTSVFYGDVTPKQPSTSSQPDPTSETVDAATRRQDKNLCHWLMLLFKIRDEDILMKVGVDGVHFQMFQRYLIAYLAITSVICLFFIMPINITQGDMESYSYGKTTISNIHPNSPVLWIHCIAALVLLVLSIVMMKHFTQHLNNSEDEEASRTLMISNIPKAHAYPHLILQHFQEAYPEAAVTDIQMAYNVRQLYHYDRARRKAADCLENAEEILARTGHRQMMFPYVCGETCCCSSFRICGAKQVDCIEYYREEFRKYNGLFEGEKILSFKKTLGIAFVTFSDDLTAARIHADFRRTCKGTYNLMTSSLSQELEADKWKVDFAPSPDGIYWHNLSLTGFKWKALTLLYNLLILIFFIFITAPSVALNKLNGLLLTADNPHPFSVIIVIILPSLILIVSYLGVPNTIALAEHLIGPWSKGMVHHSCLIKIYIALTLTILALPSIALSSLNALLEWISLHNSKDAQFRWRCVFASSNSAYFVNYIITTAFISTVVDLLRIPDMLKFALWNSLAKSSLERSTIRQRVIREYPYGVQYATTLFVFTVTMCYSITSPVISIAGLICLINKYYVDRYNLFFGFGPSKINRSVHSTAINISIVSVVLLQITILLFIILRADSLAAVNIFALVMLIITVVVLCGRVCLGLIMPDRFFIPLSYKKIIAPSGSAEEETPTKTESFVPPLLFENSGMILSARDDATGSTAQRSGYGSISRQEGSAARSARYPPSDSSASLIPPRNT